MKAPVQRGSRRSTPYGEKNVTAMSESERPVTHDRRVDQSLVGLLVDTEIVDQDLVVVLAEGRRGCAQRRYGW